MWKGFDALPNYLGGKRRLCSVIFREIEHFIPVREWPETIFLDAFMGGGSVSLFAKSQGFIVRANDLAYRSYLIGQGIVANNDIMMTDQDLGLLFAPNGDCPHFVEENFVPQTFSVEFARFLDLALHNIRQAGLEETHEALLYASLIRALLMVRTGGQMTNLAWCTNMNTGNFDAITQGQLKTGYSHSWAEHPAVKMSRVKDYINGGIFIGDAQMSQDDALLWLPEQEGDIAYLDPPYYGSASYEANYYLLECLLAGKMLSRIPTSPFNKAATAWASLATLFEMADHIPLWIVSLSDSPQGFSAGQITGLIEDFGRICHSIDIQHRWSLATTSDHYVAGSKELLLLAEKR